MSNLAAAVVLHSVDVLLLASELIFDGLVPLFSYLLVKMFRWLKWVVDALLMDCVRFNDDFAFAITKCTWVGHVTRERTS